MLHPAYIYGDSQIVLPNSTRPDSKLKKKLESIVYHFVREGVACDEWRTSYINANDKKADLLTNLFPTGAKEWDFAQNFLHHIFQ